MFLNVLTLAFLIGNISTDPTKRCIDPEEEYLEELYSEHEAFNRLYQEAHFKSSKSMVINKNDSVLDEILTDNTQCSNEMRNITLTNHQSSCPWVYDILFRENRFPRYLNNVRCTCESCIGSSTTSPYKPILSPAKQVKCKPILQQVPVLARGECPKDGYYYHWNKTYEYVNIACICAYQSKTYTHKN